MAFAYYYSGTISINRTECELCSQRIAESETCTVQVCLVNYRNFASDANRTPFGIKCAVELLS